ncbi:hypothetical protein PGT21_001952 [Puccinia graminis f. sp. tritici]|uniref:Uncharacterized protein n=1 Tax=Puccinia graminis f. sp. tritici TaxID=56615 RepID=A0A5B0P4T0_PUCGR|nr:hypothetical protein PGT21_001952 [Puccinia graminis f. sp. tritici]KAA1137202.1 hypothetical protein PGTUg99_014517 [Puccinia graminis f. sp. tritici]
MNLAQITIQIENHSDWLDFTPLCNLSQPRLLCRRMTRTLSLDIIDRHHHLESPYLVVYGIWDILNHISFGNLSFNSPALFFFISNNSQGQCTQHFALSKTVHFQINGII